MFADREPEGPAMLLFEDSPRDSGLNLRIEGHAGDRPIASHGDIMPAYKSPDFNERAAAARAAKQSALEKLRNKPAPDPALAARRVAAQAVRQAAAEERRTARQAAAQEARLVKATAVSDARPAPQSDADRKAARDEKYAARKARKR